MDKIIDLHCDIYSHFALENEKGKKNTFKEHHLSNFIDGNIMISVFNLWLDVPPNEAKERAQEMLKLGAIELTNNKDILNIVRNYNDIKNDKINYIIGLEGLDFLDDADELYFYYQYGVRLISLTWNYSNLFATAITNNNNKGLSDEGIKAVQIMNKLGIIIDVSHLNDQCSLEVVELSSKPVIASHSNARAICDVPRNLPDELIKAIAKKNGLIGINAFHLFVSDDKEKKCIAGLIEHIDYLKNLVGIDHIAFGFDFMEFLPAASVDNIEEADGCLSDLRNHSELKNFICALEDHGYTQSDIAKISYQNALRIFEDILGVD